MIYLDLFWAFFKIGLFGFGGGLAIVQLIYQNIQAFVEMTPDQFANIVAIAQATPGPVAINTATFVGYESAGVTGAFVATLAVVIPAFIIIITVCKLMERHSDSYMISGALSGIRPATVGMVASAAITVGTPAFINSQHMGYNMQTLAGMLTTQVDVVAIVICLLTLLLIGKFKVNAFKVLIAMAVIGAIFGA